MSGVVNTASEESKLETITEEGANKLLVNSVRNNLILLSGSAGSMIAGSILRAKFDDAPAIIIGIAVTAVVAGGVSFGLNLAGVYPDPYPYLYRINR